MYLLLYTHPHPATTRNLLHTSNNNQQQLIMEDVDYVAARTAVAAALGGISGASLAVFRGHSIQMLATRMAGSWAMAATACIGTQRLASVAGRHLFVDQDEKSDAMIVGTHCAGGSFGGGLLGYVYIRKPIRGMVFLTPVMLMVALAEIRFEERKRLDPSTIEVVAVTRTLDGGVVKKKPSKVPETNSEN